MGLLPPHCTLGCGCGEWRRPCTNNCFFVTVCGAPEWKPHFHQTQGQLQTLRCQTCVLTPSRETLTSRWGGQGGVCRFPVSGEVHCSQSPYECLIRSLASVQMSSSQGNTGTRVFLSAEPWGDSSGECSHAVHYSFLVCYRLNDAILTAFRAGVLGPAPWWES